MSSAIKKSALSLIIILAAIAAPALMTSCADEPRYSGMRLTGTWLNVSDNGDMYTFYSNGTGVWQGYWEDIPFEYYLTGSYLYFTFYP